MDRCPNCKARYRKRDSCHRCGMDLSWLLKINARAGSIKQEIRHCLLNGEYAQVKSLITRHQQLVNDPAINLIQAFLDKEELNSPIFKDFMP